MQIPEKLEQIASGHLDQAFSESVFELTCCAGIQITHRTTQCVSISVNQNHSLHLCTKR